MPAELFTAPLRIDGPDRNSHTPDWAPRDARRQRISHQGTMGLNQFNREQAIHGPFVTNDHMALHTDVRIGIGYPMRKKFGRPLIVSP